ncbi:TetR/AcrR family transcriptional regulator [Streptomyces virginiae]|uniref:TetR/AcrR family transcriptional regulator n=1 Tax=Streptomyces virginiae TaxID=1961 RepID=UPI0035E3B528
MAETDDRVPGPAPVRVDGRTERGRRTRDKIVDALLDLLDEGVVEFPAERVAERAGVSRRLVFHHFADMSELVDLAITRRLEQLAEQIRPLPVTGPRRVRVGALAEQRARILEWITPARLTLMRIDHPSPRIQQVTDEAFADARRKVEEIFAEERGRGGCTPAPQLERRVVPGRYKKKPKPHEKPI